MTAMRFAVNRPRVDTTQDMRQFHEKMGEILAEQLMAEVLCSHGTYDKRKVNHSLLEFDRLHDLMLPFCSEPYGHPVRKLAKLSILFMQTPHYRRAVDLGWSAVDFFGVSDFDIRDSKPRGLVPTISWTRFKGKIIGIDRDGAKFAIERPGGRTIQMWRPHPLPMTVPFWESHGLGS